MHLLSFKKSQLFMRSRCWLIQCTMCFSCQKKRGWGGVKSGWLKRLCLLCLFVPTTCSYFGRCPGLALGVKHQVTLSNYFLSVVKMFLSLPPPPPILFLCISHPPSHSLSLRFSDDCIAWVYILLQWYLRLICIICAIEECRPEAIYMNTQEQYASIMYEWCTQIL